MKNKGITLIALVITIIVLLILAGVSIASLTGEGGILGKASQAKEENLIKGYEEQLKLIWQGVKLGNIEQKKTKEEELQEGKKAIEGDPNFEGAIVEIKTEELLIEVKVKEGYIFQIREDKVEYIRKEGESLKDIEVVLTASKPQNKKVKFTATTRNAGGRQLEYIFYLNGVETQRKTTYDTTYTYEKETSFDDLLTAKVEVKYEGEKTSISEEITVEDYTISNKEEMIIFRNRVNGGKSYKDKTIELDSDIDLLGEENNQWTPIGNMTYAFEGTFDGKNHKIENLYINIKEVERQALFGQNKGIIQNVQVSGMIKSTHYDAALLCGKNYGEIRNIVTSGSVQGWRQGGGIVGSGNGRIEYCINYAQISPMGTTGYYGRGFGGIVGAKYGGTIEKCINYGEIKGNHGVGGIAGEAHEGEIRECINKGMVTGLSSDPKYNSIYIGGIAGGSSYEGTTTISNCINFAEVKTTYSGSTVGGIVAYVAGTSKGNSLIENCYQVGNVSGTTVGGIVAREGYSDTVKGNSNLTNNYWLNTCGANYGRGTQNTDTEAVSKTEQEIKQLASTLGELYREDIQNSDGTWKYNNGYPILKWQMESFHR